MNRAACYCFIVLLLRSTIALAGGGTEEAAVSSEEEDFEVSVTIDFDDRLPDDFSFRNGGHLEVVSNRAISETRMGILTLPGKRGDRGRYGEPYASFMMYYRGKLGNTITSFRTYVPGNPPFGNLSPYIVYAVNVDDDPHPEAYVVGRRIVGSETSRLPEQEGPVETWFECRFDADTLVHVADFRENLGGNFTTWNYGAVSDLIKTPLKDERVWGDLDIVHIEVGAGAGGGPCRAFVDDIKIGSPPAAKSEELLSVLENLCRKLTVVFGAKRSGTIAICSFTSNDGKVSELTILLDEIVMLEVKKYGKFTIVEPGRIYAILQEQALPPPDLIDAGKAIQIGKQVAADYILTGTIIETPTSVSIFGRIINVQTGQIESNELVNVPKNDEITALLR